MAGAVRIEKVVTSGIFSLDGEDHHVDNNIWLYGDDDEVVVVDAAHDHRPILAAVGDRKVVAIVLTHGHNDHINAAADLADATGAPMLVHEDDSMLWDVVYPERRPDGTLTEGDTVDVAGESLRVLHTPGHSPGGICLLTDPDGANPGHVFGGDTLFNGGPGAAGRSFSSYDTIIESIRTKLLVLPPETVVHTGHGNDTTVGAEAPGIEAAAG